MSKLDQLRRAFEAGAIDLDTYESAVAAFAAVQSTSHAQLGGDENVVAQTGATAAREIAVGRDVNGNLIHINVNAGAIDAEELLRIISGQRPAPDLTRATTEYLDFLLNRFRFLDLRGMGISDRVPLKLPLLEMYIPLRARVGTPEGETWAREMQLAGRAPTEEEAEAMGLRLSEPQPVLDLLKANPGLIILGDPGAGKTTFLKFLTLALATGQGDRIGLGKRLPVLVPLSAYAAELAHKDVPLDRFITDYYRDRGVSLPLASLLEQALAQGGALLLLDGLDEVRETQQRRAVVDLVSDFFSLHQAKGNKFVLTSRVVGYAEVRPRVEGLAESTLVDLEDEDIASFVDKWTAALERAAGGDNRIAQADAQRERDELLLAVRTNPGVRGLAANPLLLTILALMKRQGVTLPERRVELYEQYVRTLLKHWNLARSLSGRGGHDLDLVETLKVLAPLALWMHRTSPGVGLVPEWDLRRELVGIYTERGAEDPERAARAFLEDVRGHTGLLLDRGGRQYGFIHLTFQEYLAAVALGQRGQQSIAPVIEDLCANVGNDTWHEVALLTPAYLGIIQQRDEAAGGVLEGLLACTHGEPGQGVVLAGDALADVGMSGVTSASSQRVIAALVETLGDDKRVAPELRIQAGRALEECGDPRAEATTIDAMRFCHVPAGPFLMGSALVDWTAHHNERPQSECDLTYSYWISRDPVTVAQFQSFVRGAEFRLTSPRALDDALNQPTVWVTLYEALAFCDWLTAHYRAQGRLPEGYRVTLPSEPEWEKAARGGLLIPCRAQVGRLAARGSGRGTRADRESASRALFCLGGPFRAEPQRT
ncbi:MAG: SUMF1/EgtB/PvdO family nonheme iron enzyme [Pseudomonadota bacterium]|nr:SUMF1/EgtB/PvdO family nonheme iron enzyme [Pseudomonadota bacterium]